MARKYRSQRTGRVTLFGLINQHIPNDGVLILFNCDWANTRTRAHEAGGGLLSTTAVDDERVAGLKGTGIRDVFVFFKEGE